MGQLTHHRTGLIADAVRALVPDGTRPTPFAPEVLAAMLDLRGSVQLEGALTPRRARGGKPDDDAGPRASLGPSLLGRDYLRARLDGIDAAHARRLARPFEGRIRVPDAAATHAQIGAAITSRTAGDAKAAARTLACAYRELLVATVERLLADVTALRDEIAEDVRAHGPRAARLEALDATLRAATAASLERLVERLGAATERALTVTFTRAIRALPEGAEPAAVASWFAPGGVADRELTRIRTLTRGLLAHERAVLEALASPPVDRGERGIE